jgi:hypothetical protein
MSVNGLASADHRLTTDFPWRHSDGKTRARIIGETAETVTIAFIREPRSGTMDGQVTLSKPDFLNCYGMAPRPDAKRIEDQVPL